jgi:hypothetical protein
MNVRSLLSVAAIVSAMALPGAAYAQNQTQNEHMISGKAVPADQVAEVQAKCDELRKAETTAPAAPAATTPAPAAAAGSQEGWMADGTKIDVSKLTVKLCDEGKFTASAM